MSGPGEGSPTNTERNAFSAALEAAHRHVVSASELVPGLNTEGLTIKGREGGRYYDSSEIGRAFSLPSGCKTEFASYVYNNPNFDEKSKAELAEAINDVFKGQVVIDLGAGTNPIGFYIADRASAKGYVAVEPAFAEKLMLNLGAIKEPGLIKEFTKEGSVDPVISWTDPRGLRHKLGNTPVAIVRDDMLEFLRRLPDNSVSIFASGLDNLVMTNRAYNQQVADEIKRVLSPEGAYVGHSNMHIKLPDDPSISFEFAGKGGFVKIYKKIKGE